MIQTPFRFIIRTQPRHVTFLTKETAVRKNQENDSQTGSPCLDKPVLAQVGRVQMASIPLSMLL